MALARLETRGHGTPPGARGPARRPTHRAPACGARGSGARKCTQTINFPPRPARARGRVRPPPAASPRRAPHSGSGDDGGARLAAAAAPGRVAWPAVPPPPPPVPHSSSRIPATARRRLLAAALKAGRESRSGAGGRRGPGAPERMVQKAAAEHRAGGASGLPDRSRLSHWRWRETGHVARSHLGTRL